MRKESRREEKVIYTDVFVANDGTEFKTQEECEKYEKSWEGTINASFQKVPHVKATEMYWLGDWTGCEDFNVYLIKPRNLDDIRVINEHFHLSSSEMLTQDNIGVECFIGKDSWDSCSGYLYKDGIDVQVNAALKAIATMRNELENFGKETETEGKENAEN